MQIIHSGLNINYFDKNIRPISKVASGDTVWVEVQDCYNGQIKTSKDRRSNIDKNIIDCCTGPIEVMGSQAGDTLCVEIKKIIVDRQGIMIIAPGLGMLGDKITEERTKIVSITRNKIRFAKNCQLPITPMVGVIGVAPQQGKQHCSLPGKHGGNLDTKIITNGSKVFLPVFVSGALLALGDLHAGMGDGETSGTGIEISGRICMKITVLKNKAIKGPIVKTKESIYFLQSGKHFAQTVKEVLTRATQYIMEKNGCDFIEAYFLVSCMCDLQISQIVNARLTLRIKIPKRILQNDDL